MPRQQRVRWQAQDRQDPPWSEVAPQGADRGGQGAARSKGTYLGAQHARIKRRRGPAKATGATRHSIIVAAYYILRDGVTYHELGADYFDRRESTERHVQRLVHQLEQLGQKVILQPAA